MKVIIQRVKSASVTVENKQISKINFGYLILFCFEKNDLKSNIKVLSEKILNIRLCADENMLMNKSIVEAGGEILLVSQFTLCASLKAGRRPSFLDALEPQNALEYFNLLSALLNESVPTKIGAFGKYMNISLIADGPVTIPIDLK